MALVALKKSVVENFSFDTFKRGKTSLLTHSKAATRGAHKKAVLKNFAIFTENTCVGVSFLITKACKFIKTRIQQRCFPVSIAKFLKTYFEEHLRTAASMHCYLNVYHLTLFPIVHFKTQGTNLFTTFHIFIKIYEEFLENILSYGFSLNRIFPYKDRICPYMGKQGSEETRILAYFTQCYLFPDSHRVFLVEEILAEISHRFASPHKKF